MAFIPVLGFSSTVGAHEISANRATLVLRDKQHLALTFFVDYAAVLHLALAPKRPLQEFLAQSAAMPDKEFQGQLNIAKTQLQNSLGVMLASGKPATLSQWVWPANGLVRDAVQQRAMQAIVAPQDHAHGTPLEIRVEAKSANPTDFKSIKLKLPPELQQVLVVSYQPKQVWIKPNAASPTITFE
jgi:predicted Abi (CAAX) family protease